MNDHPDLQSAIRRLCGTAADDPGAIDVGDLFDVARRAGASERYRLARALDRAIAADPPAADGAVEHARALFASDVTADRRFAAVVVELVAGRDPGRAVPAIDLVADGIRDRDPFVRRHSVWALAHLSDHDPELAAPLVPDLRPGEDQPPYLEHEHVVLVLRNVARKRPDATTPMLPSLFELLAEADAFVGSDGPEPADGSDDPLLWLDSYKEGIDPPTTAAALLVALSEAVPGAVAEYVTDLAAILESVERVTVRRDVVEALANLAVADPAVARPAIPALGAQLRARDDVLRARTARALALAFDSSPEDVVEVATGALPALEPLLRDGTPPVRNAVAGLLSCVAEVDPERVRPFTGALIACLDPDRPYAAASAAIALGYVGDADARAALERVAASELDPHVREPVERAVAQIDARGVDD